MPTYGEAKRRDVIGSVLPSTRRKFARESFAAIKRRHRRKINQAYQKYRWDDPDDVEFDFNQTCDRQIREIMWERRDGDKLGALMRWAPVATKEIRAEDRVSYLYSVLPDNTIGRHAVGHAKYVVAEDEFSRFGLRHWRETMAAREAVGRSAMVEAITAHMEFSGWHTRFNLALKGAGHRVAPEGRYRWRSQCSESCEHQAPLLLGIHDIEEFVDRLWEVHWLHPGWWGSVLQALGMPDFD